jgi:hypothetical protein
MSTHARREMVWSVAKRYRDADRSGKKQILDEFCKTTGHNRKYAIGLLNRPPAERSEPIRRKRCSAYAMDLALLTELWEVSGRLCAKRLMAGLQDLIDGLERFDEINISAERRTRFRTMSASTADRLLRPVRRRLGWRGKTTTKPGTLLKHQIAVRTFADWNEQRPGFMEIDLVAHCADSVRGEYAHTLTMTDVATGWTELTALRNRSQKTVLEAIRQVSARLPFRILGLDSDNGAEFINYPLKAYCEQNQITFTRCRPCKKNDQCHVENKNGSIVRTQTGYFRYETEEALKRLRALYSWLRLFVNYFAPSAKLVGKHRNGAKVTKQYDTPTTPYKRLLNANVLNHKEEEELKAFFHTLNPKDIRRQIEAAKLALYHTASVRSLFEATDD